MISRIWQVGLFALLAAGVVRPLDVRARSSVVWAPIAVAALTGNRGVAVLSRTGEIWSVGPASKWEPKLEFRLNRAYSPADLAVTTSGTTDRLLVTSTGYTGSSRSGRLEMFTLGAASPQQWPNVQGMVLSGVSPDGNIAYVGDALRGELLTIDLARTDAKPEYVASLPSLKAKAIVGSVTVDRVNRQVFIADAAGSGNIYRLDQAAKKISLFAQGLNDPRALAVDAKGQRLLVADGLRRCVWAFPLRSVAIAKAGAPWLVHKEFREPNGIAAADDGTIWVGDAAAGRLFNFNAATQQLTRTIMR